MTNLDDIRAMLGAITPGEWLLDKFAVYSAFMGKKELVVVLEEFSPDDAAFIAASPRIVRELLAEVVTLRDKTAEQSAIIAGLGDVIAGRVKPIDQLWIEIDTEDGE